MYISKELLDLDAQRSPAELPTVCGFSKRIKLKIKTLFSWLQKESMNWLTLSFEEKIKYAKTIRAPRVPETPNFLKIPSSDVKV